MNKLYPRKQAIITGLISGIFAASAFSVLTNINDHAGWGINAATIRGLFGLFTLLILVVGVYTGLQHVKRSNGGKLSYAQAIASGALVGLTVGVFVAVIGFVYTHFINPHYGDYMLTENKRSLIAAGKSATEIANSQANLTKMLAPAVQIMQALVLQTGCAVIFSLIIGLFLKTKR